MFNKWTTSSRLYFFAVVYGFVLQVTLSLDQNTDCGGYVANIIINRNPLPIPEGPFNLSEPRTKVTAESVINQLESALTIKNTSVEVMNMTKATGDIFLRLFISTKDTEIINNFNVNLTQIIADTKTWGKVASVKSAGLLYFVAKISVHDMFRNTVNMKYYNNLYTAMVRNMTKMAMQSNATIESVNFSRNQTNYVFGMCIDVPITTVTFPADEGIPFQNVFLETLHQVLGNNIAINTSSSENTTYEYVMNITEMKELKKAYQINTFQVILNKPYDDSYGDQNSKGYLELVSMITDPIDGIFWPRFNQTYLGCILIDVSNWQGKPALTIGITLREFNDTEKAKALFFDSLEVSAVAASLAKSDFHIFERRLPSDNFGIDWNTTSIDLVPPTPPPFNEPSRVYPPGPPAKAYEPKTLFILVTIPCVAVIVLFIVICMLCTASSTSCLCNIFRDNIYSVVTKK